MNEGLASLCVDNEVAGGSAAVDRRRPGGGAFAMGSTQQGFDPEQQFFVIEWFGQIIVCAGPKANVAINDVAFGREHEYGHLWLPIAYGLA